ncbi:DNA cytosine methyltransferase [Maribellus luteus]|uniref:Cytosine-specific methyltransferase n=1 Tax=Maribellus luteus TaxID=2305463 RepID=A0A399T3E9_9BACT|nr:DNA cytosine methyltransferase [Maribellus luteus]RIJ48697.1 DNA cytosine methyltransferase [Maribellus luteus]
MKEKTPIYIDLFAGCGGLSLGLHNAGWKGLFAIEKNSDAFKTLEYNLIKNKNHFDWPDWLPQQSHEINELIKNYKKNLEALRGKVELVAGGPPCQGFSTAGRRKESDSRNNLVKSYIKFIGLVQPKLLFFENVKGFTQEFKKNKDKGKKYASYVEEALKRKGYYVKGQLINFGDYGIPQKRTRFILVGIHKSVQGANKQKAKEFFNLLGKNRFEFLKDKNLSVNTNLKDAISDLLKTNGEVPSPDSSNFNAGIYSITGSKYQELMRANVIEEIPDSHRFANHKEKTVAKFQEFILSDRKNKNLGNATREKHKIKKHTIIPLDGEDKSPTITTLPDDYIHYSEPRILTVREYARIQSFPDWYKFRGKYTTGGKLRTQEVPRYSQIGNAIPPLFGEQSGEVLKQLL